jgi:hypothetical protein
MTRLIRIKQTWLSLGNRAEAAVSRADVAKDHKRRRTLSPTLEDVRTPGFLADRVKAQVIDHPGYTFEVLIGANSNF